MTCSISPRACLVLFLALPGCGPTPGSTDTTDGSSSGESSTSESSTGESGAPTTDEPTTGSTPSAWPKRVTLVTPLADASPPGVRLADGTLLADGGDIRLNVAYVLALRGTPDSICEQGTFPALGDVPTDLDTCSGWSHFAYLDASSVHTEAESAVIGLGLLVWDEAHTTMYRLRVLGDSYDEQGQATVTFDYEPASASP